MAGPRNKPGTERFRDEAREGGGARVHGREWHDHTTPKPLQPEAMAGLDAIPEVESSGDRLGMGRDLPKRSKNVRSKKR